MPDMHTLCSDMPEALKCFGDELAMGWKTGKDFGIPRLSGYSGARGTFTTSTGTG